MSDILNNAVNDHAEPPSTRASAEDLPEELFAHILEIVKYRFREYPPHRLPSSSADVRDFGSLVLVSRYFAAFCRPTLFRFLKLRNRKHVAGLVELLDYCPSSLGTPLLAFVQEIHVSPDEAEELCIRRILTTVIPRMSLLKEPTSSNVRLTLSGPDVLPVLVPSHSHFPHSLPPSLYCSIRQLHIYLTHFNQGEDLLRCLSSLRHTCEIRLTSITCHSAPIPDIIARLPLSSTLRRVSGFNCEPTSFRTVFPAMLNAHLADINPLLLRDRLERTAFTDIVMAAHKLSTEIFSEWSSEWNITRTLEDLTICLGDPHHVYDWAGLRISLRAVQHPRDLASSDNTERYDCVFTPEFSPGSDKALLSLLSLDFWATIADHVSRLRRLKKLTFEFVKPREMQAFVVSIYPILSAMYQSGRYLEFSELWSGCYDDALTIFQRYECGDGM